MFKKSNIPNFLTMLRIFLGLVVIILLSILIIFKKDVESRGSFKIDHFLLAAGIVFIAASVTDFLDGYIARKYSYVSEFGKFFDPIADKVLINATLILFIPLGLIPFWITLILILRDTVVDFIRMILSSKQITLSAGILGKLKTVFQMVGLSILFFLAYFVNFQGIETNDIETKDIIIKQVILIPMYIATAFSLISGVTYFIKAKSQLF
ncbi:CDP-diacylglycerol--glycerol-3-phosphate 3-phosphatidyltransferase [Entomoplasma ellychniae]|uniref:CDP-diacylglycerol--glycerol-3-phosphate 3-phosphatidyltransferase n=1 Tax=Entomoplasma ellychniae TaxID=2114 RepID=A0A8E2QXN2_9MOLU|nr:CDP-diacylglycerol--glycerol-3-phosphate 3-phosphatidyltransferase [Entomoplasma ellychniae]PPE04783.1 CDP-diacylglycerol--glycerol-3-phosphate 3-phosphatidyltransferase [Entomoplasma ellychniae]